MCNILANFSKGDGSAVGTLFLFLDPAKLTEVNLGFAISATSLDSTRTFKQMQDIINSILEQYPPAIIYHSVISFGYPVVHVDFKAKLSLTDLKKAIDSIEKPAGKALLDKALEKARSLFKDAAKKRPSARNVLVVFVDKKSGSDVNDVKASSRLLKGDGVKVIVVGVGGEVHKPEIDSVSPTSIFTNTTDSADSVALKIVTIVDKGKNNQHFDVHTKIAFVFVMYKKMST